MGPIVKIKKWRAKKAREALKAKIETELKAIKSFRREYTATAFRCPRCDALCNARDSIRQAGLVLAQAEKDTLERLAAISKVV